MSDPQTLTEVVAAVRRDAAGRVWLCRRKRDGSRGGVAGLWEYPGGKVERGEDLPAALAREMEEEFGVTAHVGALIDVVETPTCRVHFYAVDMPDPSELHDHSAARWLKPGEALMLPNMPSGIVFNERWMAPLVGGLQCPNCLEPRNGSDHHDGDRFICERAIVPTRRPQAEPPAEHLRNALFLLGAMRPELLQAAASPDPDARCTAVANAQELLDAAARRIDAAMKGIGA